MTVFTKKRLQKLSGILEEEFSYEDDLEFTYIGRPNGNYDPIWDFEPAEHVDSYLVSVYEEALIPAESLAGKLHIGKPVVYFADVESLGDHIARYINGTSTQPVIVASTRELDDAEAEKTLFHELGHAYIDSTGTEVVDEEGVVEEFARMALGGSDDRDKAVRWLLKVVSSS